MKSGSGSGCVTIRPTSAKCHAVFDQLRCTCCCRSGWPLLDTVSLWLVPTIRRRRVDVHAPATRPAAQELQLYLDRVSQLLRAGGRLRDVLASGAEEEAYQKAVLASLATDPGADTRRLRSRRCHV